MKNKILLIICLFSVFALSGCKKYLEVYPKSSVAEDELFETETGFQQAITGVYSQMASRNLYGDNLTMGFISALAQNYAVSGSGVRFVDSRAVNLGSAEVQNFSSAIWSTAYSAIAGANKVISNCDKRRNLLSDQKYAMFLGEALALRAYLHFDLLRLFGPVYAYGASLKAIPYKTTVDQNPVPPSTTAEVIQFILKDLKEAEALMNTKDPIFSGALSRQINLNYYAVKALQARVLLYSGNNIDAYAAAKIVIDSGRFPFISSFQVSTGAGQKDRLYLREQVFCIRVRDIKTWVDPGYYRSNGGTTSRLTRSGTDFNNLFQTASGGTTDFRYAYGIEADNGIAFPSKYWQTYQFNTLDSNRLDQYVPGIRVSEMYYIMAETAPTVEEGITLLNTVRGNRGLGNLSLTIDRITLQNEILREHQKEFYAEGQLWYYYKRKVIAKPQFISNSITMDAERYRLPIPQAELEFNPTY